MRNAFRLLTLSVGLCLASASGAYTGLDAWVSYSSNGHYYKIIQCGTWEQCETAAVAQGAHLVTIRNANENTWLVQTFDTSIRYWIGLSDRTTEGRFVWVSGETSSYTNWASNQPDDYYSNEDCAEFNNFGAGNWNDETCTSTSISNAIIERTSAPSSTGTSTSIGFTGLDTWVSYSSNGHYYKIIQCGTWEQCETAAVTQGAHLVTIRNANENGWLGQTFDPSVRYWIGLNDRATEGPFVWVSGETSTYTNWKSGEPNDYFGNEDCAEINNSVAGGWNDFSCTSTETSKAIIERGSATSTADTQAPSVPTNLTATTLSSSQINLSWTSSIDNVGVTSYKVYRGGSLVETRTTTTFGNSGLSASTSYSYTVAACDAAGNCSAQSSSVSATTSAAPDTQAPTAPTGLTATAVSSSQISLSWTSSIDAVGVTAYKVYRDSALLTTLANVTSYSDTGLTASTSYTYKVSGCDAAGNCSSQSTSISATTSAAAATCAKADLDAQFLAGKNYCINNPTACGIQTATATTTSSCTAVFDLFTGRLSVPCFSLNGKSYSLELGVYSYSPSLLFNVSGFAEK